MAQYKILDELGRGAMGIVYRAVHGDLGRQVALKFLSLDKEELRPVDISRFEREIRVLKELTHPNVIKILDAGCADGRLYYAMELLAARDLESILSECASQPLPSVVSTFDQLLDALSYIHEKGMVHRDIKPANIMVEPSGRAILMDFGLARHREHTLLTAAGSSVGTPRYFAPELFLGKEATVQSDLWSLATTVYWMIAGRRPFEESSLKDLARQIARLPAPPLRDLRPEAPALLCAVVHRCLEKDPRARWPSAREARDALAPVKEELGPAMAGVTLSEAPPPPAPPDAPTLRSGRYSGQIRRPVSAPVPPLPRVSGPLWWTSLSLSASLSEPRARWTLILAAAGLAGLVLAVGFFLFRGARSGPVPDPEGLRCVAVDLQRLRVEFSTSRKSLWTLEREDGRRIADSAATLRHELEIPRDPWRSAEALVLAAEGRRIPLTVPPSPAESIRRLSSRLRGPQLTEATMDQTWVKIRPLVRKADPKADFQVLRPVSRAHPEVGKPLEQLLREVIGSDTVRSYEELRPLVSPIILASSVPPDLLGELFEVLYKLDQVDALASHLGVDLPFGIQDAMAPAIRLKTVIGGTGASPELPGSVAVFPPPGVRPAMVFLPDEVPTGEAGAIINISESRIFSRLDERDRDPVNALVFREDVAPGGSGKAIHFTVGAWGTQTFMKLRPPGMPWSIPVRLPNGVSHRVDGSFRLSLTLSGPLASLRGEWSGRQTRVMRKDYFRPYIAIDQVHVQPLP